MNVREHLEKALRVKYEIPQEVEEISIEEDSGYGSCSHDWSSPEVSITYQYIPSGKKRKVRKYHTYYGTLLDLIYELDAE